MTLGPRDKGVRLAIGVSGAGKSHKLKNDAMDAARAGVPVVVIDTMHEWEAVPPDLAKSKRVRRFPTVEAATKALDDTSDPTLLAIVTPDDAASEVDAACRWAMASEELRGVVVHEAWQVAGSNEHLSPPIRQVTRAWRHHNVAAWLDAQRVSMLSRHVTELATELRLYAIVGDRDFAVVREIGGRDLEAAVRQCATKLSQGEPGWYVELGSHRMGPFVPKRGKA